MRLKPGEYFGDQLVQRKTQGLCLTLCRYPGNRKLPRHSHVNPGFFFLLSGDHLETDERRAKMQPETSMIYHTGGAAHENDIGPKGMVGLNISFDPNWLHGSEMASLNQRSGWVLEKPLAKTHALRLLAGLSGAALADLDNTGVELLEMMGACQGSQDRMPPQWLRTARDIIDARYAGQLSLANVAHEVSVHPVYLARAFRKRYRCTFTSYLHHVRLLHAVALATEGMSLGQAAAECGFCDQGHLARVVRAKLGVTPSSLNWFKSSKSNECVSQ
jgi:AraC family transcriptional regulator